MNSVCCSDVLFLLRLRLCLFFALLCVRKKDSLQNLLLLQLQLFDLFLSILLSKFQIVYSLIDRWPSPSQSLPSLFFRLISKFFLYLYLRLNQSHRYRWADSSWIIIHCCLFDQNFIENVFIGGWTFLFGTELSRHSVLHEGGGLHHLLQLRRLWLQKLRLFLWLSLLWLTTLFLSENRLKRFI